MFAYSKWLKNKNAYQSIALLEAVLREKKENDDRSHIFHIESTRENEKEKRALLSSDESFSYWSYYMMLLFRRQYIHWFSFFLSRFFFVFSNRKIDKTKHIIRYRFEVINIVVVFKLQMCFFPFSSK